MRILGKILKVFASLPVACRNISIVSLVTVAALLFLESVIRTLCGTSIIVVNEVGGAGMVLFIFLALGWVYQQGGHLRVGFLADRLPKKHILELILSILSLLFVGYLGYLWWDIAFFFFQTGKFTPIMRMVEWPFYMAVIVGWGVFIIAILEHIVVQVRQILGRFPTVEGV